MTIPQGIDPLKTAVEDIISQLKVVQEYVNVSIRLLINQNLKFLKTKNLNVFKDILEGRKRPNAATGRLLTDFFHSIPRADPEIFEKMLNSNVNDYLMVLYLSQLANVELSLNEKLVMAQ